MWIDEVQVWKREIKIFKKRIYIILLAFKKKQRLKYIVLMVNFALSILIV